jgi:hypothetical protein
MVLTRKQTLALTAGSATLSSASIKRSKRDDGISYRLQRDAEVPEGEQTHPHTPPSLREDVGSFQPPVATKYGEMVCSLSVSSKSIDSPTTESPEHYCESVIPEFVVFTTPHHCKPEIARWYCNLRDREQYISSIAKQVIFPRVKFLDKYGAICIFDTSPTTVCGRMLPYFFNGEVTWKEEIDFAENWWKNTAQAIVIKSINNFRNYAIKLMKTAYTSTSIALVIQVQMLLCKCIMVPACSLHHCLHMYRSVRTSRR